MTTKTNPPKPPKGYRLLRNGEVIRKGDRIRGIGFGAWTDTNSSIGKTQRKVIMEESLIAARRLASNPLPTPSQAWRWLAGRQYKMRDHPPLIGGNQFRHELAIFTDSGPLYYYGSTPLACVRAAMKAEKRGKG